MKKFTQKNHGNHANLIKIMVLTFSFLLFSLFPIKTTAQHTITFTAPSGVLTFFDVFDRLIEYMEESQGTFVVFHFVFSHTLLQGVQSCHALARKQNGLIYRNMPLKSVFP